MRSLDRFQGCLIGAAAGDALGYPVEFAEGPELLDRFGVEGIRDYELEDGVAVVSDDTQMTMFTAAGLLYGSVHNVRRNVCPRYVDAVYYSYLNWLYTQDPSGTPPVRGRTWLMNVPRLFRRRAPGTPCLCALRIDKRGTMDGPFSESKGCGGAMRVAPVGLYFNDLACRVEDVDLLAAQIAALTHGHRMGYIPAAFQVHMIHRIAQDGCSISEAVDDAIRVVPGLFPWRPDTERFLDLLDTAQLLSETADDDRTAIERLGGGWSGDEAVAIGVYCALRYPEDLDRCLLAAVNHAGDSDSTGNLAGSLVGASIGYEAIPQKYLDRLEMREEILQLAKDLHAYCPANGAWANPDPEWDSRYLTGDWTMPDN